MTASDGESVAEARSRALRLIDEFVRGHTGLSGVVPDLTLAEMGLSSVQCAALLVVLEEHVALERTVRDVSDTCADQLVMWAAPRRRDCAH